MRFPLFLLCGALSTIAAAAPQSAVVIVPFADVWSRPLAPGEKPTDDLRETQVLLDEVVLIHESSGPWVRIEAVEQQEYTHHNMWEGYPGWVFRKYVGKDKYQVHFDAVKPWVGPLEFVEFKLGTPYLWGGLTREHGFDCSGLIYLAYRQAGNEIPRDAHEQWMKANPIKRAQLKPTDLIFSAKADNPKKITHVAMYAGTVPSPFPLPQGERAVVDGLIIEAPQTGMVVRKISFKEKYGKALGEVESGDRVGHRVIYFGSFLALGNGGHS